MKIQVLVRLKSGVLDVQGKAVEHGLQELGLTQASHVRMGKLIEMDIEASSFEQARSKVEDACRKFLVNPIIEQYEIRAV